MSEYVKQSQGLQGLLADMHEMLTAAGVGQQGAARLERLPVPYLLDEAGRRT